MGNLNRIELLKQFSLEEPDNPFNWYALALEYQELEKDKTVELFDKLLSLHKSYLPTYYPAAHFFAELGKLDKAEEIFEAGINLAGIQKNEKAIKELRNAFQNFKFENDLDD